MRTVTDFVFRLQDHYTFYIYGNREYELSGEKLSPIRFDMDLSLRDVISELDVDIVLLPNHAISKNSKIKDIDARLKIPKAILENDYYSVSSFDFYRNYNIDLIINQGADRIPKNIVGVDSVWLPFAVPENDCVKDISIDDRINKIVFVGGGRYSLNNLYRTRQFAIRELESADLLDYIGEVGYYNYPIMLKKYVSGLSDSFPPMFMAPLKTFEMMSYGTAVLTTKIRTGDILFGNEQCFFEYELENVSKVVKEIVNDKDKTLEVRKTALSVINKRHLFSHRLEELGNIFKALTEGKEIPKKWGF